MYPAETIDRHILNKHRQENTSSTNFCALKNLILFGESLIQEEKMLVDLSFWCG